jgi:PPPDE putative peptidase domain
MEVQCRHVKAKDIDKLKHPDPKTPNGFKDRILVGQTRRPKAEVERIAIELANTRFNKDSFDRFSNNCGTFANTFAKRLTTDGKGIPKWINRATEAHPKNWLRRIEHYLQKKKVNGIQNPNVDDAKELAKDEPTLFEQWMERFKRAQVKKCGMSLLQAFEQRVLKERQQEEQRLFRQQYQMWLDSRIQVWMQKR